MKNLIFNITLAWRAIRNNRLRSGITIAVIALGIMSLVGILTGIEVMKVALTSSFSSMGVNSFQINSEVVKKRKRGMGVHIGYSEGKTISYTDAKLFKERFKFPALVSLSANLSSVSTIVYGSLKTNPNISITGADEGYLSVNDYKLTAGRNFSVNEVESGAYVCIIGDGVANKLFKQKAKDAIGKSIMVGSNRCTVIGVLESKGASMFMNSDNNVLLPLNTGRQLFGGDNSYVINVFVDDVHMKEFATEEAEGVFRVIRKTPLGDANDFNISQNNDLVNMVMENTIYIQAAAIAICIITLLNSVIGLMNIMLESVSERTREIGVSKALGARSSYIRSQFLTEAVIISVLGGGVGVIMGLLLGNLVGFIFKVGFVVPWLWIAVGVLLCAIVGIVSGLYPAIKASKLNPITALRYE